MQPQAARLIKPKLVRSQCEFRFSIRRNFLPLDGSLAFRFANTVPKWISIDSVTGVISGIAPATEHPQQYAFLVEAYSDHAAVQQSLFINVYCAKVAEVMAHTLKNILSLRKKITHYPEHHATIRELLEYIFEYYQASEYKHEFLSLIWDNANRLDLKINQPIAYKDFKKVIERLNPGIEKQLQKQLEKHHVLLTAALNNQEFRRLYRQGSQRLGTHPIAVWNYLMAPRFQLWSESAVSDVLSEAAEFVIHLRVANVAEYAYTHALYPRPLPPGR